MQFDIKKLNELKEIILRISNGESLESLQADYIQFYKSVNVVGLMLLKLELINGDHGIAIDDVKKLSSIHHKEVDEGETSINYHPGHPIEIFKEENTVFQVVLNQIKDLIIEGEQHPDTLEELKRYILRLGEFHNHYNRKEKLFFPILERYGYYAPARKVWKKDDRIRALYQALKKQLPDRDFTRIRKRYEAFEKEFKEMIFQEEAIILPILQSIFSQDDWTAIADESNAFGYALIDAPEENWVSKSEGEDVAEMDKVVSDTPTTEHLVLGGGGYLTTEEAKHILNNLPLEITFVDKRGLFKYFNDITEASEMMLVRTPSSIGRIVANCHPPKSLKKVMALIRDLKTGKRTSESMWYKKKGQYIHITYKSIFNEEGEFLGILEYVQDIQPFFELPSEIKTGLSDLDE